MSFKILTACWFAWFWVWSVRILVPTIMPEIQLDLSLSTAEAAVLVGVFNMSVGAGFYIFGSLGNKMNKRKIILYGLAFSILAILAFSFTRFYSIMLLTVATAGLGLATYLPNATTVLSEVFPQRGSALGMHETAAPTGQTIGSLLVWIGSGLIAWEGLLSMWALFGLVPIVLLGAYFYDRKPTLVTKSDPQVALSRWGRKQWFFLTLAYTGQLASITGFLTIMPIYMVNEFGLGIAFVAFILGVTKITGPLGQVVGGWLSDKYGRKPVLLFITAVVALTTILLSFLTFNEIFIGALFAQFLIGSAFFPVTLAGISDHTHLAERSGKIGFMMFFGSVVGGGFTPVVIGFAAERVGYQTGFLFPIALTIAGVFSAYFLNFASRP